MKSQFKCNASEIATMDNSFNALLSDMNVPNHIDDLDEFLNSSWNHKAIDQGDFDALYAELNQPLLPTPVASPPSSRHADPSTKVSAEYTSLNRYESESGILTPQASPILSLEGTSDYFMQDNYGPPLVSSFVPLSDVGSLQSEILHSDNPNSELMVAVRNRLKQMTVLQSPVPNYSEENDSNQMYPDLSSYPSYEKHSAPTFSLKYTTESESPTCESPLNYKMSEEAFMTQASFSPTSYIPFYTNHSEPPPTPQFSTVATQPNAVIVQQQPTELQTAKAEVSPVGANPCCDSEDSIQPAPGMSCAEYLSSVQLSPDPSEAKEPQPTYYILVQNSQASNGSKPSTPIKIVVKTSERPKIVTPRVKIFPSVTIPTVSADRKPILEQIDLAGDYVQIQNSYVLPSEGMIKAFPVEEIYRIDRKESQLKKKPRKANINYGTDFYCHLCQKEFGKRGSFQQHWRQKHEDPRPFRCDTCGKTYLTERDLRQHRENHDPTKKQWKCTECDNRYRHMKDRDRHYDSHHGTPGHPCIVEGCDKAFARRDHMLAHLVSHNNRTMREIKKAQEKEEREQGKAVKRGRKRKIDCDEIE